MASLLALLKPGGWAQLVEAEPLPRAENGPAINEFLEFFGTSLACHGLDSDYPRKLEGCLEKAGLEHLQDRELLIRYGAANPDEELQSKSIRALVLIVLEVAKISDSEST